MYKKNYVIALKTDGKILREQNDRVELPFGYEYSVLLKNLNSVRAVASLSVDGVFVADFIVPANGDIEVERFIKNGNLHKGNKFKFIERTQAVEEGRGIKAEDGLIRVEFKKEIVPPQPQIVWHQHYQWPDMTPRWPYNSGLVRSCFNTSGAPSGQSVHVNSVQSAALGSFNMSESSVKVASSDVGITVPGGLSDQRFVHGAYFSTENTSEVLVLHIVGKQGKVRKPVTVDVKPVCQTCKKHNKATSQFCSRCGTSLRLV